MYIRNDYSSDYYAHLLDLRDEILKLDPERGASTSFQQRSFLLEKLKITRIKSGSKRFVSLRGNNWLGYQVSVAMREVVRRAKKYLDKFRGQYERDVQEGKLGMMVGAQTTFTFLNWLPDNSYRHRGKADLDERRDYFIRQR